MDSATVMHRWCNKDFGRNNTLTASRSCHSEGRNYFSYSTVFGQWVDMEKNVVVIYEGGTTSTSSKYRLCKGDFPKDVHVFPYDDGGSMYYYHGCNLVSSYGFSDDDFKQRHRIKLLDYFVDRMYERFRFIRDSKVKGCEHVNFDMWWYFLKLCTLYKDISPAKYLKTLKQIQSAKNEYAEVKKNAKEYNAVIKAKKVMVKLLAAGEGDVQTICDAMFGAGTYKKYMDEVSAKFDKAERTRRKMLALCERLGIANPYERWCGHSVLSHDMSAADIRKLTAKQRNELHFKALAYKEYKNHEDERKQKYNKNRENAFKWVVGYSCDKKKGWRGYEYDDKVTHCRNMFTGEEYDISGEHIYGFYWCNTAWIFDYDGFRKSEDKTAWIEQFYAMVKRVQDTRKAISILKWAKANIKPKESKYSADIYVLDEKLTDIGLDAESLRIVTEFIQRQDDYYSEQERVRRARELQRQREKEEEERERAYREQVKQEQIDECLGRGVEGRRDLWRLHLTDIWQAEREGGYKDDFYMGGNILLRFNLDKTCIETSKGIRIPLAVCKKFYPIFKGWHENPKTFKPITIDTKGSGRYTISEYENDILTAGCHDIAWTEMERMWNEIEKLENVA